MDSFSYLLQDIDPLLLDEMDFPINSCGKSDNYLKDLGSKNGENSEGTEKKIPLGEYFIVNKSQEVGFVSEFSSGYNHEFKKIESLIDSDKFKKQDSLVEDSLFLPAKRTRYDSQIAVCQVQGCYKDLRSSKDYHKKHRVCAIHAKSTKVFLNGIEKRFCQQCSRFHVLKEFDDVKRSCPKRLAGHNERRRKPYIVPHIGGDSSLLEMDLVKSEAFFRIEKNPISFFYQEKYEVDDHNKGKRMKLEKFPGAKEVEVLPVHLLHDDFAPSLLSFNSKKYSPEEYPESIETCPAGFNKSSPEHSVLNSFIRFEHQKSPVLYDGIAGICSQTERYYYKDRRFNEAGSTLDLLHLSPHLKRVEKLQQNSVQMKQENI